MSRFTGRGSLFAAAALALAVTVAAWFLPARAVLALLAGAAAVVMVMVAESDRRVNARLQRLSLDARNDYRQVEALFSLFASIRPELPLPDTRGWAASPDLLKLTADTVLDRRPGLVVEASSGVSTLVIAYCLKRLGHGRVVSLEHDEKYLHLTRELIARHGLDSVATVVHAPLRTTRIAGAEWPWYDVDALRLDAPIDLLLIDGPPRRGHPLARYPALPLLFPRLADDAVVILDDGDREAETETVRRWEAEFEHLSAHHLPLEKGAWLLRLSRPARDARPAAGARAGDEGRLAHRP
ncbi:MAG TPA: class I SAM-dependent methyltransferase [Longimicrobium sp.]|nr:class I SAM-dependent methyltransferase [Longimicrobium sp.]